nr:hypothetical protein [Tanacetum cinerariifolium]
MDTTIDQQVATNEALVPHARRLRIGRSNFRLLSDISFKESTLQLVYDVLRLTPFFKAFLVTADVPKIYMHEFWGTATVHHHSIRFKMDNKKHIVNQESFREMLHICLRLPGQLFVEPPFEEEILAFLRFLGHSEAIRRLTDVNINKLHQPWRSFAAIINKCLTRKSSGYDSLRLSQAQILWGLYHKRNIDFTYLMWGDFVYQVKHKDTKKSNEMYYPRFTKNTQQFGAMLPIEPTNADIRNSDAYKEYYAVTTGATPPKPKASVWKTRSSSDTTVAPPTAAAGLRLSTSAKGKQPATTSKAKSLYAISEVAMTEAQQLKLATKRSLQQIHISQASGSGADEGTGTIPGVPDVPIDESEEEISWNSTDEEGNDDDDDTQDDDAQDDDDREDEGNHEDDQEDGSDDEQASDEEEFIHPSLSTHAEEKIRDEESFDPIPKTPKNTDDEGNGEDNFGTNVGRKEGHDEEDEEDELYRDVNINLGRGVQMADVHTTQEFEDSHVTLTPRMNEAVKVAVQLQSDRLRDEAQKENDEFLKTIDENMQRSSRSRSKNKSRNLYKALVEAYEFDKIILDTYVDTVTLKKRRDDDADKDEEPSAGSDWGSKRRKEGNELKELMQTTFEMEEPLHPEFETGDDDQPIVEPSQHLECELAKLSDSRSSFNELMDTPVDFSAFLVNRLKVDTLTPELLAGPTYELMKGSCKSLVELEFFLEEVYKATTDQLDRVNPEGQQYPHNVFKPLPLIPNSRGRVIPFDHFINNDLEYLRGGASSRKYTNSVTKTKEADYRHIKWIEDLVPRTMWIQEPIGYDKHAFWRISHWGRKRQQFYGFAVNREFARDVYSIRRIIAVTELKIIEWHNYKHLD